MRSLSKPAVGFELGFAGPAQPDAALLTLEMGPAAHQTRGQMLELGQLDLQLALVRARATGEDIQNQPGAIEHARIHALFEVAFLARRQIVVEHHEFGAVLGHRRRDLVGLAAADEKPRVRNAARAADMAKHIRARGFHELTEFLVRLVILVDAEGDMDDDGRLTGRRPFKHERLP